MTIGTAIAEKKKRKFYFFATAACVLGFGWLLFLHYAKNWFGISDVKICFIRNATGIPCPSCGSSRAVEALIHGDVIASVLFNPFGIIIAAIMVVLPLWLLYDAISKQSGLYAFFEKTNRFLGRRTVIIALIIIVVLNWGWNIFKYC